MSAEGAPKRVGESGADAVTLSFHPVKHVTTAEGGAILTNDEALYRELVECRTFGTHKDPARFHRDTSDPFVGPWYYETDVLAFNYRLSDVHCALGSSQLRKLSHFIARRREIAKAYDAALDAPPLRGRLGPLSRRTGRESAYHLYVVQIANSRDLESTATERRQLFLHLASLGIHCQVHYVPLPWQPYYRALAVDARREYPGAARYYASSLSLPMFPKMTAVDVERVVEALRQWVR
jgi:dTDP-4-amino-4,6-dideoxygalactose transaminase